MAAIVAHVKGGELVPKTCLAMDQGVQLWRLILSGERNVKFMVEDRRRTSETWTFPDEPSARPKYDERVEAARATA